MKKIIVLLSILFCTQSLVFAQWYKLEDGIYIETQKAHIKGNYLYLKLKQDNIKDINNSLKIYSPGVLLDESIFNYLIQDFIVDCKKPRYKVPLTLIYDKNNNIINKVKNNTWYFDLPESEWDAYCKVYDSFKNVAGE